MPQCTHAFQMIPHTMKLIVNVALMILWQPSLIWNPRNEEYRQRFTLLVGWYHKFNTLHSKPHTLRNFRSHVARFTVFRYSKQYQSNVSSIMAFQLQDHLLSSSRNQNSVHNTVLTMEHTGGGSLKRHAAPSQFNTLRETSLVPSFQRNPRTTLSTLITHQQSSNHNVFLCTLHFKGMVNQMFCMTW